MNYAGSNKQRRREQLNARLLQDAGAPYQMIDLSPKIREEIKAKKEINPIQRNEALKKAIKRNSPTVYDKIANVIYLGMFVGLFAFLAHLLHWL